MRYDEAVRQYELALALARRLHSEAHEGELLDRRAIALRFLDRLDEAAAGYARAIDIAERMGTEQELGRRRLNLAACLVASGFEREATDQAAAALRDLDRAGDTESARTAALLILSQGDDQRLSEEARRRVQELADAAPDENPLAQVARMTIAARELAAAGQHDEAGALVGSVGARLVAEGHPLQEVDARLAGARILLAGAPRAAATHARRAWNVAVGGGLRGRAAEAKEIELAAAAATQDMGRMTATVGVLLDRWSDLRRDLVTDAGRRRFADHVARALDPAIAHMLAAGDAGRALELRDWRRSQALLDLMRGSAIGADPPSALDLAGMRATLAELGRPALAISLGLVDDELVALALRPEDEEPTVHRTGMSAAGVAGLIETFQHEMHVHRGAGSMSWRRAARPVLRSVSERVRPDDLVVLVAEGELELLPLQAVPVPGSAALVERAAVVHAPSITALSESRRRPVAPWRVPDMVTIGGAFPDEARAIGILIGAAVHSSNRLDKAAVLDQVANALLVHFSCHGVFVAGDPLGSGLLMTTAATPRDLDDVLTLEDLLEAEVSAELVTLSACDSGLEKPAASEFVGLARSLLAMGCRSVTATLWQVDESATLRFMMDLYREMRPGDDEDGRVATADALRAVQMRWMAHGAPVHQWAAFKLIGSPDMTWPASLQPDGDD